MDFGALLPVERFINDRMAVQEGRKTKEDDNPGNIRVQSFFANLTGRLKSLSDVTKQKFVLLNFSR